MSLSSVQRSSKLTAQLAPGWIADVDPQSGHVYYYNELTGESRWEAPPDQHAYGAQPPGYGYGSIGQVLLQVEPTVGVYNTYYMRNGDRQEMGRWDMDCPNPYISRTQCFIEVDPSGIASLTSVGKPPTALRAPDGEWYEVRYGESYVVYDGQEFSLDCFNPETAYFTIYIQQDGAPQQNYYETYSAYY